MSSHLNSLNGVFLLDALGEQAHWRLARFRLLLDLLFQAQCRPLSIRIRRHHLLGKVITQPVNIPIDCLAPYPCLDVK